jgi:hypothetical protein
MSSVDLANSMTASQPPGQAAKERRRWWPRAAVGLLLLALCLGWFLLPLREWIEALQSWLLGLGLWGVLIFTMTLIVVTFLPARLEGLERVGMIQRRKLPPPASVQIYELTPWGYEAEIILKELGRWATPALRCMIRRCPCRLRRS